MPDYALHFIDGQTNFEIYYGEELEYEREEVQQKNFYEKQKKAFLTNQAKGKGGRGRKDAGMIDFNLDEDEYGSEHHEIDGNRNLTVNK